ncbi:MAG TPA: hypothetical protein VG738_07755 [Chitinophagaceae bacterium]|nr:hypothetical protein [Chitinophagaceae bacterium]
MMKNKSLPCLLFLAVTCTCLHAQKFDTTVKMNNEGFRVICSNKDLDNNYVTVQPVGITLDNARQLDFPVRGKVSKAAIDDLNNDGEPDLVICIYGGVNGDIGSVIGVSYMKAEKTVVPIVFPDIYSDPKIREGYKGHDTFSLVIGTLLRKFPIYLPGDAPDKPTGGIRTVQYNVVPGEQGRLSFKVLRSYETQPEN